MYPNNNNYYNYNPYYSMYGRNYGTYQIPNNINLQILQQQQMQMPQQQMQQRPQQPNIPIQGVRFLTEDEIKAYIVMPNSSEMLVDMTNHIAHIKSADSMGQSSEKLYKFEEIDTSNSTVSNTGKNPPELDTSTFAKTEDLGKFVSNDTFTEFSKNLEDKLDKLERKLKIKQLEENK